MRKTTMLTTVCLGTHSCVVTALLLANTVHAHHSLSTFDMSKRVVMQGTVKEFRRANPHTWITLLAKNTQGELEEWSLEGGSVSILVRNGWNWKTLKPGDQISLSVAPRKDGSHGGHFSKVTLPDGRVMPETPDF